MGRWSSTALVSRSSKRRKTLRRNHTAVRIPATVHGGRMEYSPHDHMAVQQTLDRCGVILVNRSQVRMAPGPQPQRGPPQATDCGADLSAASREGQRNATGATQLTMAHWNAEGVRLKKPDLQNFLRENSIDVCGIQETHLTTNHRFFIRGYETYRHDRQNRPKGGVAILVRNNIPSIEIARSEDGDTEYIGVELVLPDKNIQVFNVYSPPDKNISLHNIKSNTTHWIAMGDFNSHSPSWGYSEMNNKGEDVESWAIEQQLILINKPGDQPTYYSRSWRTTSTPDIAFATDSLHKTSHREVCAQLGGSDHRPVILRFDHQAPPKNFNPAPSWNYKKADWENFKTFCEEKCANFPFSETNMNQNAENFNNIILSSAKESIPRGRRKNYNPSWSPTLAKLEDDLKKARDSMEEDPSDENITEHNRILAAHTREKLQQSRTSWHEKTASLDFVKESTKVWNLTKTLNDETPSYNKTVLKANDQLLTEKKAANEFARFYKQESNLTIPLDKVQKTKTAVKDHQQTNQPEACMKEDLKMGELEAAIQKLKPKKAPGPDGVTNDMLKRLGPAAKNTLLAIFNRCWHAGELPSIWKEAHIIPILKKGKEKTNPANYRPISLLSCVGKLMERIVTSRLTWYLEKHNILSATQTGYRQHRNTEDQLAYLTQEIENAFQEKKKLLAVFFDLSRAFDRVWKKGLQLKLLQAGISSCMYKWISSFLYHRTARVKLDRHLSDQVKLKEGVPQGSVISPMLFLNVSSMT